MLSKRENHSGFSIEEAEQRYRDAQKAFFIITQRERTALSPEEKKALAYAVDTLIPLYQEASVQEREGGYDTVLSLDNRAVFLRDRILWYAARFLLQHP